MTDDHLQSNVPVSNVPMSKYPAVRMNLLLSFFLQMWRRTAPVCTATTRAACTPVGWRRRSSRCWRRSCPSCLRRVTPKRRGRRPTPPRTARTNATHTSTTRWARPTTCTTTTTTTTTSCTTTTPRTTTLTATHTPTRRSTSSRPAWPRSPGWSSWETDCTTSATALLSVSVCYWWSQGGAGRQFHYLKLWSCFEPELVELAENTTWCCCAHDCLNVLPSSCRSRLHWGSVQRSQHLCGCFLSRAASWVR